LSKLYFKCLRRNVLLYLRSSAFICGFGLLRPVIYAETSALIDWIDSIGCIRNMAARPENYGAAMGTWGRAA
jgi:hypothetical protein